MSTLLTNKTLSVERQDALRAAIELFYFAYRAFTAQADRHLAEIGLGRVHHRILYFVGRNPDLAVNALIDILGVSKQAINAPLRQLIEMEMVSSTTAAHDRRVRQLRLTAAGSALEQSLSAEQMQTMETAFAQVGVEGEAVWRRIMATLAERP
ncbi:MAG: MarR family winged helix-turn-helix transcriptional regulator [Betaproteobacteria bacterium]